MQKQGIKLLIIPGKEKGESEHGKGEVSEMFQLYLQFYFFNENAYKYKKLLNYIESMCKIPKYS